MQSQFSWIFITLFFLSEINLLQCDTVLLMSIMLLQNCISLDKKTSTRIHNTCFIDVRTLLYRIVAYHMTGMLIAINEECHNNPYLCLEIIIILL